MKKKFSIDKNNQLLIKSPKSKIPLKPKGEFAINKNNQLEYYLNEPIAWRKLYDLPSKIVFVGSWALNENHDLELRLNVTRNQLGKEIIVLKGEIISAEQGKFVFEIAGEGYVKIVKFSGIWQADDKNRIIFKVQKKILPDTLIFGLAWQVNQNQKIEYVYEKTNLKTKTKTIQSLIFEGFWNICPNHKITYSILGSSTSKFEFRAYLENPNLYPTKNIIKYRLGIGVKDSTNKDSRVISLYGQWKFSRNLGLIFSMDYGDGVIKEIEFGAEVSFNLNSIIFSLKDRVGEPLGITLTMTHKFINSLDPAAFIRLKSFQKRFEIEAGLTIPF